MKTQTNNSLFTDIELDKAANVNGGLGVDYSNVYGGFETAVGYYAFLNSLNQYGYGYYTPGGYWVGYNIYGQLVPIG